MASVLNWDPQLIARVDDLEWRSRVLVEGFLIGPHRSALRGYSAEFAQHHAYIQGDDPRHLDWKVLARTDRLFIREFDAETNLRLQVILDGSASMDWNGGAAPWRKWDYAALLAAGLLRLASRAGNAIGVSVIGRSELSGSSIEGISGHLAEHLPARLQPGQFRRALGLIDRHQPSGSIDLGAGLERVAELIPRRSAVVVLTDGWEDLPRLIAGLGRLRHDHHDVVLLQTVDRRELDFAFSTSVVMEDPETGARLPVVPSWSRSKYLERLGQHQRALAEGCRTVGFQHVLVASDESPFHALATVLAGRSRRSAA